jgi:radical SAM superfamily enzyme YgiQ (UPF0313 family)
MSPETLSRALDALVLRAQKPSRYVGGELGSVRKDLASAGLRFALAFPDTYEVGMSNLGFRLLYHLLNDRPEIACERVFLPWPDLEGMLREERLPLFTLESRAPVAGFDVLGITLQFELAYTSVLALLDLAGIPLLAAERGDDHPLVLGGGRAPAISIPIGRWLGEPTTVHFVGPGLSLGGQIIQQFSRKSSFHVLPFLREKNGQQKLVARLEQRHYR